MPAMLLEYLGTATGNAPLNPGPSDPCGRPGLKNFYSAAAILQSHPLLLISRGDWCSIFTMNVNAHLRSQTEFRVQTSP